LEEEKNLLNVTVLYESKTSKNFTHCLGEEDFFTVYIKSDGFYIVHLKATTLPVLIHEMQLYVLRGATTSVLYLSPFAAPLFSSK
jgi:hypothetical protein